MRLITLAAEYSVLPLATKEQGELAKLLQRVCNRTRTHAHAHGHALVRAQWEWEGI
jgi:hypothetical protein